MSASLQSRYKRPGSYGAFLLAAYKSGSEVSITQELKRAKEAGVAVGATEAVVSKLATEKFWRRDNGEVWLTEKGLQYLKKHGLVA